MYILANSSRVQKENPGDHNSVLSDDEDGQALDIFSQALSRAAKVTRQIMETLKVKWLPYQQKFH